MTVPTARARQIARLRRRLHRHERRCLDLLAQAEVEGFYARLMRDRLAVLEAEPQAYPPPFTIETGP